MATAAFSDVGCMLESEVAWNILAILDLGVDGLDLGQGNISGTDGSSSALGVCSRRRSSNCSRLSCCSCSVSFRRHPLGGSGCAQCGCGGTLGVGGHALGAGGGARGDAAIVRAFTKRFHGVIFARRGCGNGDRDSWIRGLPALEQTSRRSLRRET